MEKTITTVQEPDARQMTRLQAFARLINERGGHQKNWRGDAVYDAASLLLNDRKCAVCLRDNGTEMCFTAQDAKIRAGVFGDEKGKAEWFIGVADDIEGWTDGRRWLPGDPLMYVYTFLPSTADEAIEYLQY